MYLIICVGVGVPTVNRGIAKFESDVESCHMLYHMSKAERENENNKWKHKPHWISWKNVKQVCFTWFSWDSQAMMFNLRFLTVSYLHSHTDWSLVHIWRKESLSSLLVMTDSPSVQQSCVNHGGWPHQHLSQTDRQTDRQKSYFFTNFVGLVSVLLFRTYIFILQ